MQASFRRKKKRPKRRLAQKSLFLAHAPQMSAYLRQMHPLKIQRFMT